MDGIEEKDETFNALEYFLVATGVLSSERFVDVHLTETNTETGQLRNEEVDKGKRVEESLIKGAQECKET